ncbi:hypothetical protein SteCoe_18454 [Stentor coeruleus]|uniref:Uncharacterized protein n=1 Tax=Stentor coeruleus TaxID=5963 RepID=A0A1R2BWE8_9CILI|nr:hypothetical protein SteCoe_18454 [Stentor coeruleus]
MERPLKLRKQSYKKLLVLLKTAEEILFSYSIPTDIASNYEGLRNKIFSELRIKNTPISITRSPYEENSQNLEEQKTQQNPKIHSQNAYILELFATIQKTMDLVESYQEELEFKVITIKNIYNTLSEINNTPEKGESISKTSPNPKDHKEFNLEQIDTNNKGALEAIKLKIKQKVENLQTIKQNLSQNEEKVIDLLKSFQKKIENLENAPIKKYTDQLQVFKTTEKKYEDKIKELNCEINTIKQVGLDEKILNDKKISELLSEISQLEQKPLAKPELLQELQEKIAENINLKEKNLSLELLVSKTEKLYRETSDLLAGANEKIIRLTKQKEKIKEKLIATENQYQDIEKALENDRQSYEDIHKNMQKKLIEQETSLKEAQDEYIQSYIQNHQKKISTMTFEFHEETIKHQQEIETLHQEISEMSISHEKIVKALQFELLKSKELTDNQCVAIKSSEKINEDFEESQKIIKQLEESLNRCQNTLKFLQDLLIPIYETYSSSQRDWIEEVYIKKFNKNIFEGVELLISSEFTVFYLKKNIRDKQWLVDKLEEMHTSQRLNKTASAEGFLSPNSLKDKDFLRQIWQDIKNTAETLRNFEKSRENLMLHFSEYKTFGTEFKRQWPLKRA